MKRDEWGLARETDNHWKILVIWLGSKKIEYRLGGCYMKLSVSKKLWGSFLSLLLFLLAMGTVYLLIISELNNQYTFLLDDRCEKDPACG